MCAPADFFFFVVRRHSEFDLPAAGCQSVWQIILSVNDDAQCMAGIPGQHNPITAKPFNCRIRIGSLILTDPAFLGNFLTINAFCR